MIACFSGDGAASPPDITAVKTAATCAIVLDNVLLGSNPHSPGNEGWPWLAGRTWDVRSERRDGRAEWSLACHHSAEERVGPGTVGWIHRWSGHGLGELAAVIVFEGFPRPATEPRGTVHYARGRLTVLDHPIPGESIIAGGEWSGAAPYNRQAARQFASGVSVTDADAAVLLAALDDRDRKRFDAARAAPPSARPIGDARPLRRGKRRLGLRRPGN